MLTQTEILQITLKQFAIDFIKNPYAFYTEPGLHGILFIKLFNAFSPEQRYFTWNGNKVCAIQQEYPTADTIGKSQRQHWDIALIKTPPQSICSDAPLSYDYLKLSDVVEFGLNEAKEHLEDDIRRLSHAQANIEQGYLVHLYRLSKSGAKISGRDWGANSKRILTQSDVAEIAKKTSVEIFYGMYDGTGKYPNGVWQIKNGTNTLVQA